MGWLHRPRGRADDDVKGKNCYGHYDFFFFFLVVRVGDGWIAFSQIDVRSL